MTDAHGIGTFKDPITIRSAGEELQLGCTGCPADSHIVRWLVVRNKQIPTSTLETMKTQGSADNRRYPESDRSNDVMSAVVYTR